MQEAPNTLVFYYNEAIIQMGFIAFFAVTFPFAPLFSFLTNLLEILIKLKTMATYGRRGIALCSNGIGNWMSIVGFISYFAIPINLCILLIARSPGEKEIGALHDLDTEDVDKQSAMTQYLLNRGPFWTRTNIFILAIFIEHLIIGLKVVIALLIPDVPGDVKEAEKKRAAYEFEAKLEMRK